MREKIAELHVAVTVTAGHPEFHLANESIDQILALLREAVEKRQNIYFESRESWEAADSYRVGQHCGFEYCRSDILALLRGGDMT